MIKIGFIGIGQMGRWMSGHLLKAGYAVSVYDVNLDAANDLKESGALIASSVAEIGSENDVVILMLPNSRIVESVVTGPSGLLESMAEGTMIIDMGSSYALSTEQLEKQARIKGIILIDAPVSGGVKGAKAATLTIMVGAAEEAYVRALPIFQCMGKTINLVGKTGAGHALKAINNYLSAASMYATTEAMIVAKKLGLNLEVALKTINQSSGQSFSTHYKFPTFVLPRTFNSEFSLDLLLKDVNMVTELARDRKVPILLAGLVEQIYEAASVSGEKNQDHTEIIKFLEKLSDCCLEEKTERIHESRL